MRVIGSIGGSGPLSERYLNAASGGRGHKADFASADPSGKTISFRTRGLQKVELCKLDRAAANFGSAIR